VGGSSRREQESERSRSTSAALDLLVLALQQRQMHAAQVTDSLSFHVILQIIGIIDGVRILLTKIDTLLLVGGFIQCTSSLI
jgi:hypothetical protein